LTQNNNKKFFVNIPSGTLPPPGDHVYTNVSCV